MAEVSVSRWLGIINQFEKDFSDCLREGKNAIKRYRDQREQKGSRRYNIFWANVQTMKPALLSRFPEPVVGRRFTDDEGIGRIAATMLERALRFELEQYDFTYTASMGVMDYLVTGMGQLWVRYEPTYGEELPEQSETDDDSQPVREVMGENVVCDLVPFEDFGFVNSKQWSDVDAVWKKVYLNRDELVEQFGEKGKALPLTFRVGASDKAQSNGASEEGMKACVYEIWDKPSRKVIWFSKDNPQEALKEVDDPLNLKGFFPCPRPLFATQTTNTLIPVADYTLYKDQQQDLDELTRRIAVLTQALKAAGLYDASLAKGGLDALVYSSDGVLVPVDNWAMVGSDAMENRIIWLPVEKIAAVLQQLMGIRESLKRDIDEITGISDIIRGEGAAGETATAQQLKGQFASQRIAERQREVQRFIRDVIRIKAEIIAEQFSDQSLMAVMANVDLDGDIDIAPFMPPAQIMQALPPEAQEQAEQMAKQKAREVVLGQAIQVLRNDVLRDFNVDIETDSTIATDEAADKQARVEFASTVSQYLQQLVTIGQQAPDMAPLALEMLLFIIRGFRAGRSLEAKFEQFIRQTEQKLNQPKPQQADPAQAQMQAEAQKEAMKAQTTMQIEQMRLASKEKIAQIQAQVDAMIEQAKIEADTANQKAAIQKDLILQGGINAF